MLGVLRKSIVFFIDHLDNMGMKSRKGYKYRLRANRTIAHQCVRFAGACRFVWNRILAINERRYLAGVPRHTYADSTRLLTLPPGPRVSGGKSYARGKGAR